MTLDNWNDYTGKSWLKAEEVKGEDQAFVCVGITLDEEIKDGKKSIRPVLELEFEKDRFFFSLNVTNSNKCKEFVSTPKDLVGKKIYFKKALVTSPSTKKEVETLRIKNIA
jgi:hypothetical protein